MTTAVSGDHTRKPRDSVYRKSQIGIGNGYVTCKSHVPFLVKVTNFSTPEKRLGKNQVLGYAVAAPIVGVFAIDDATVPGVVAAPATELAPDGDRAATSVPSIPLEDVPADERDRVRAMSSKYENMWDGHLGAVPGVKHRIDLIPGANPFRSQPYRAGPSAREV